MLPLPHAPAPASPPAPAPVLAATPALLPASSLEPERLRLRLRLRPRRRSGRWPGKSPSSSPPPPGNLPRGGTRSLPNRRAVGGPPVPIGESPPGAASRAAPSTGRPSRGRHDGESSDCPSAVYMRDCSGAWVCLAAGDVLPSLPAPPPWPWLDSPPTATPNDASEMPAARRRSRSGCGMAANATTSPRLQCCADRPHSCVADTNRRCMDAWEKPAQKSMFNDSSEPLVQSTTRCTKRSSTLKMIAP